MASDEDRVLEWLGLDAPPESVEPETISQPITGTDTELPVAKEPETTRKETITWDGNDKIVTEEIVTKEEQIIFGDQIIRTAPEYVKVTSDEPNEEAENAKHVIKDTIEIDTGEKEVEEETCMLDAPLPDESRSVTPEVVKESDVSEPINSESFEKIDHDELTNKSEAKETEKETSDEDTRPNSVMSNESEISQSSN